MYMLLFYINMVKDKKNNSEKKNKTLYTIKWWEYNVCEDFLHRYFLEKNVKINLSKF